MGVFYSDNEISTEFFHPLESFIYPISPDAVAVSHLGFGISYQLTDNVLTGLEYHFRNTSHPQSAFPDWGLAQESLNLGMEMILTPTFTLRTGYVQTGTDKNPASGLRIRDFALGNRITLGIGYHSSRSKISLDFTYNYSFKKYEEWYLDWDVKSKTHLLSLSLKKTF